VLVGVAYTRLGVRHLEPIGSCGFRPSNG